MDNNFIKNQNNKRIAKNSVVLYLRTIITMIIGFVTSRVVLQNLGVQDYGIYNVVGGIASMFVFFNSTMSVATSRFMTFELGTGNKERLKTIYSQAKIIHYILSIVIFILIEITGFWLINNKLSIPVDRHTTTFVVLHTAAIGTALGIIATPDMALVISHERMRFFAYITMLDSVLRLVAAMLIAIVSGDRLVWYAVFMFLVFGIDRIVYLIYCKVKFEETRGKLMYSPIVFKSMLSFAGWNILGNLANMTREQGLTIIINIFTNPAVNAARAITTQISNSITSFVFNVRTAVNPQITKSYAEGDMEYMHKLIIFSSLSCFYMLLIILCPFYFFADTLFKIWLVEVPQYSADFFRLSLVGIIIYSFTNPLIIGIHATGKIVKFQVFEGLWLLTTLPLAYMFLRMGYNPTWAYIAIILSNIFTLLSDILIILPAIQFNKLEYIKSVMVPAVKVFVLSIIIPCVILYINTIYPIVCFSYIISIASFVSNIFIVYYFALTPNQRVMILSQIQKIKK